MKPSLLLVDDEPFILKCLRRVFMDTDYEIHTAESAAEALEILETNKIDLVISDMCMPHVNGYQFLQRVTALYPSITRIILTGYSKQEDLSMAVQENIANIYLTKPFDNNNLAGIVKQLLD